MKTPQKREPRRKEKKAREVAAAGRHAGQVVVHNGVPPDWEDHKVICLVCFCNELEDLGADVEGREDLTHAGDCDVLSSPDKVLKCARSSLAIATPHPLATLGNRYVAPFCYTHLATPTPTPPSPRGRGSRRFLTPGGGTLYGLNPPPEPSQIAVSGQTHNPHP